MRSERCIIKLRRYLNYNIQSSEILLLLTKIVSYDPLDPIALMRFRDAAFADNEAQPCVLHCISNRCHT